MSGPSSPPPGRRRRRPPAGSPPGTLSIPPGSPPPRIHAIAYGPDRCVERELADPRALRRLLRQAPEGVVWVHVEGLGDEATLRSLARLFALHPTTLEDATNVPARARFADHGSQLVLVVRVPWGGRSDAGRPLEAPQVCLVLEKRVVLTFQERRYGFLDPVRERIREEAGPFRRHGADYLAYAIADALVDAYEPRIEELADALEDLEDEVLERPPADLPARLHRVRRELTFLGRIGRPQREALTALAGSHSPLVGDATRVFLRDVAHHMAQILELVDSSRETGTALAEIHLAKLGQRTNEIMKVLTLIGSLFIPLTFITGVYGMNFEHMPELGSRLGYPAVLALMAAVAAAMLLYFRRRGWLGGSAEERSEEPPRRAREPETRA